MPKFAIISGGTATNELVPLFTNLSQDHKTTYILPISDNGGSTSEIIRVIGGPAIGDIRSRLTRLIPPHQRDLRDLLSFRLSLDPVVAKSQWNSIVEGTHELWTPLNSSTKEVFRSFFVHLHVELLKRSRITQSNKRQFRYELANVGNLFLTGVRLFIGSLDSSIELFCKLTDVDAGVVVLPCINTNFTYHISAILENGLIITGQSQISHPSQNGEYPPPIDKTRPPTPTDDLSRTFYFNDQEDVPINEVELSKQRVKSPISRKSSIFFTDDEEESGNVPQYTHPELKKSQLHFNKSDNIEPLLSPIKRIFYVSPYGEEICPTANARAVSAISGCDTLIYSIGSLMTSIIPILVLKGVGKAIVGSNACEKILLLNGCLDRETFGMTAADFVRCIVEAVEYSLKSSTGDAATVEWNSVVSRVVYMSGSRIAIDEQIFTGKGIKCTEVKRIEGTDYYDLDDLESVLSRVIHDDKS
ncbi:uncharacterized protein LODBEIA_P57980 [Lodderomyces beijingensis]|uniref:Uncharacterized protein n=1 Tax=Lodderomyces beijingensis TaxID=1775926 RepID=A0ABP0ZTV1_9ASCO